MLHHSSRLANPMNPFAKELKKITSKRTKTEDDYAAMAEIEWKGGLYTDADGDPCIPADMIEATLLAGAKKNKLGLKFKAGVMVARDAKIIHGGPKGIDALWADGGFIDQRMVVVQRNKILRTRPVFNDWSATIEVQYLPSVVDEAEVKQAIEVAGLMVGLGDYRPKFGRFEVAA